MASLLYDDAPKTPVIPCQSRIAHVDLYRKGAVVRRQVELPTPLPQGSVIFQVKGLPAQARSGSFKARFAKDDPWQLVSLKALFHIDETPEAGSALQLQVEDTQHDIDRVSKRLHFLDAQCASWAALVPEPGHTRSWKTFGPLARVQAATLVANLVHTRVSALQARRTELRIMLEDLQHRLTGLLSQLANLATPHQHDRHPTWHCLIECQGSGPLSSLELAYTIDAASWWPTYTLDIQGKAQEATLTMDAMVAQQSGEAWDQATLSLSTAALHHGIDLPKLRALYLGKTQPAPPTGYRPQPEGLDKLFEAYDRAKGPSHRGGFAQRPPSAADANTLTQTLNPAMAALSSGSWAALDHEGSMLEEESPHEAMDFAGLPPTQSLPLASFAHALSPKSPPPGAPMAKRRHRGAEAPFAPGGGFPPSSHTPPPEPQGIAPQQEWLEFDRLRLAGPDAPNRGQLFLQDQTIPRSFSSFHNAALQASNLGLIDVVTGNHTPYEHRYDAQGLFDVPSDGKLHRVHICHITSTAHLWWRTVPVQEQKAYRMCQIVNTAQMPLLNGPLMLHSGGKFVRQTVLCSVCQGGTIELSLGVDERIRVARNAHIHEEQKGLLGGKIQVAHEVQITLASNLGFPARVEVLDRVPQSADSHSLEVQEHEATPAAIHYHSPGDPLLQGGRQWTLDLDPAGTRTIDFGYTLVFGSREEIVGGNRRG